MNPNNWDIESLKDLPTIHQGQCCNCKIDTGNIRIWLCRGGNGISIEQYQPKSGRWVTISDHVGEQNECIR